MTRTSKIALVATLALSCAAPALPASAAIRCDGGYQINSQGEFESPYCQERLLSQLSGVPVETIRRSWSAEQNACRFVGNDIRIMQFCNGIVPRNRRCIIPPCF